MEEEYMNEKKKFDEKKLMMREAGFVVLVIILFLQYFKFAAYLENQFFFNSPFKGLLILILGIPLCYLAAKYLVKVIKKII
ncbi:hypothetical protein QTL97_15565 [Sporosarcina thermotolerans]|uniref:DUF3955 domain-containing protein n=1 Tax=Sporosarcina thermotolerans TaxID=633404 RepID=A0AAW9ABC8_9BACL|nr:hypothetical protein [Sporosarcina thermotolerans]MDW0118349.1 hypothetical protein [Sporosarcina thermotolerans]